MGKPWARYEVGFINHDKFKALSANAICLWIEGKNYADANLTDGLLPRRAVSHFRFYSKKNVQALETSAGAKSDGGEDFKPLWEPHDLGWKMAGYLEYNECREKTLARIERDRGRKGGRNSTRIPSGEAA